MSKVIAYKNTDSLCFCQMQFDSKERILVSIASTPEHSIKVIKLLFGIIPFKTIWEFSVGGGQDGQKKLTAIFTDQKTPRVNHPLDAIITKLRPCRSCNEAVRALLSAEGK